MTSRLGTGKPLTFFHSVLDKGSLAFHCTIQYLGIMLDILDFNGKIVDVCELKQLRTTTNFEVLKTGDDNDEECEVWLG